MLEPSARTAIKPTPLSADGKTKMATSVSTGSRMGSAAASASAPVASARSCALQSVKGVKADSSRGSALSGAIGDAISLLHQVQQALALRHAHVNVAQKHNINKKHIFDHL